MRSGFGIELRDALAFPNFAMEGAIRGCGRMTGLTGSYSWQEVLEGTAAKYPRAPFRGYFAECWNIVFALRRLDLA